MTIAKSWLELEDLQAVHLHQYLFSDMVTSLLHQSWAGLWLVLGLSK